MSYKIQSPLKILSNKKGVVFPLFAILAPVMLGTGGLAIDSGHIFLRRTQIQKTLDASALKAITLRNTIQIPTNSNLRSADINEKIEEAKRKSENFAKGNLKLSGIDYIHPNGLNPIRITYIEGGPNKPTEALATVEPGAIQITTLLVHILDGKSQGMKINLDTQRAKAIRPPALLAMVLDTSGSMTDHMDTLKQASKDFVDAFDPQMDQIAIISYGTRAKVVRSMQRYAGGSGTDTSSGTIQDMSEMIDTMTAEGDTNIQEGIIKARLEIERVARAFPDARRFMVILSDGAPTAWTARFTDPRTEHPNKDTYPIAPWNGKYVYKQDLIAINAAEAAEILHPNNPLLSDAQSREIKHIGGNVCEWYPFEENGDTTTKHQVPCHNFGGAVLADGSNGTSYFQDGAVFQAIKDWTPFVDSYAWQGYNPNTWFTVHKKNQVYAIGSLNSTTYLDKIARCSTEKPIDNFVITGNVESGFSTLASCLNSLEYLDSRDNPHNGAEKDRGLQVYFVWPERYPAWHAALFESDYAKEIINTPADQHKGNIEIYTVGFGVKDAGMPVPVCYSLEAIDHIQRMHSRNRPVNTETMEQWIQTCPGQPSSMSEQHA